MEGVRPFAGATDLLRSVITVHVTRVGYALLSRVRAGSNLDVHPCACRTHICRTLSTCESMKLTKTRVANRAVGNDHFCDTTKRASQKLTTHIKGEIPLYHRSGDKPLDLTTLVVNIATAPPPLEPEPPPLPEPLFEPEPPKPLLPLPPFDRQSSTKSRPQPPSKSVRCAQILCKLEWCVCQTINEQQRSKKQEEPGNPKANQPNSPRHVDPVVFRPKGPKANQDLSCSQLGNQPQNREQPRLKPDWR